MDLEKLVSPTPSLWSLSVLAKTLGSVYDLPLRNPTFHHVGKAPNSLPCPESSKVLGESLSSYPKFFSMDVKLIDVTNSPSTCMDVIGVMDVSMGGVSISDHQALSLEINIVAYKFVLLTPCLWFSIRVCVNVLMNQGLS